MCISYRKFILIVEGMNPMNISKRISSIFQQTNVSLTSLSNNLISDNQQQQSSNNTTTNNDETGSVGTSSEVSGSVLSEWTSMNSGNLKQAFSNALSSNSQIDNNIDELIRGLYIDPDILERNCLLAAIWEPSINPEDRSHSRGLGDQNSGRLSARFKVQKTVTSVTESLSEDMYSEMYDSTKAVLSEVDQWSKEESIQDHFMKKIEETDTDKDYVVKNLSELIEANYTGLNQCMYDITFIDADIMKAEMQVTTARRNLSRAYENVDKGALKIVKLHQQKDNILLVMNTLKSVANLKELYQSMLDNMICGQYGLAADCACNLLRSLTDDVFGRFAALQAIAVGIQSNLSVLRLKSDKALKFQCGRLKYSSSEYASVIRAYALLDYMSERMGCRSAPVLVTTSSSEPPVLTLTPANATSIEHIGDLPTESEDEAAPCLNYLPARVMNYMAAHIQSLIHSAVVEAICEAKFRKERTRTDDSDDDDHIDNNSDDEHKTASSMVDDISDLSTKKLSDLYRKISPELVCQLVCRSCEILTDLVHSYYLMCQWHQHPFDPRNDDSIFIHSNILEVKDKPDPAVESEKSFSEEILLKSQERLHHVHQSLLQYRILLWHHVETALLSTLRSVSVSANTSLDDYLTVVWAISAMVQLGHEFCHANSKELIDCLKQQTKLYFQSVHNDSFNMIRQMIENESWFNIPLHLTEMGGVLGLIRKNYTVRAQQEGVDGMRTMTGIRLGLSIAPNILSKQSTVAIQGNITTAPNDKESHDDETTGNNIIVDDSNAVAKEAKDKSADSKIVRMLPLFPIHGNPFHFEMDLHDRRNDDDSDSDSGEEQPNNSSTTQSAKFPRHLSVNLFHTPSIATSSVSSKEEISLTLVQDFLDLLNKTNESLSSPRNRTSGDSDTASSSQSVIVTLTSMKGLVKYAGKYMQMLFLMPSLTNEVFPDFCKLIDYYLCAVFLQFVPPDERKLLLTKQTKMTAVPPDQSNDFSALQQFISQALRINNTEIVSEPQTSSIASTVETPAALLDEVSPTVKKSPSEASLPPLPIEKSASDVSLLHHSDAPEAASSKNPFIDDDDEEGNHDDQLKSDDKRVLKSSVESVEGVGEVEEDAGSLAERTVSIASVASATSVASAASAATANTATTANESSTAAASSLAFSTQEQASKMVKSAASAASAVSSSVASNMKSALSATMSLSSSLAPPSISFSMPSIPSSIIGTTAASSQTPPTATPIDQSPARPTPHDRGIKSSIESPLVTGAGKLDNARVSALLKVPETAHKYHLDSSSMYGLYERIVAVESCYFVAQVIQVLF